MRTHCNRHYGYAKSGGAAAVDWVPETVYAPLGKAPALLKIWPALWCAALGFATLHTPDEIWFGREFSLRILIETDELARRVAELAFEVRRTYELQPLTVLGVMTGSLVLMADLIRQLDMPLKVGVLQARSYRGTATTAGQLQLNLDMMPEIAGNDVLVVDDIFDTGHTLHNVLQSVEQHRPASVRSLVLLSKRERHEVTFAPDFVGFDIPNEFVVGYGLDYQDLYRNLPYVAALEPHEISPHA